MYEIYYDNEEHTFSFVCDAGTLMYEMRKNDKQQYFYR